MAVMQHKHHIGERCVVRSIAAYCRASWINCFYVVYNIRVQAPCTPWWHSSSI